MIKKSPYSETGRPILSRGGRNRTRDSYNDGIIYPPRFSMASPIPIYDLNNTPLTPAVPIDEGKEKNSSHDEKKNDSTKRCGHSLTTAFVIFVGIAVLLKTYIPDILTMAGSENDVDADSSLSSNQHDKEISIYDSSQPSAYLSSMPSSQPSPFQSTIPNVWQVNVCCNWVHHMLCVFEIL